METLWGRGSVPSRGSLRRRDCADCAAFGRGPLRGNCSHACNGTALRVLPPPAPPGAALCRERTSDGRVLVFLVESGGGDEDEEGGDVSITVWAEEGECVWGARGARTPQGPQTTATPYVGPPAVKHPTARGLCTPRDPKDPMDGWRGSWHPRDPKGWVSVPSGPPALVGPQ